MQFRQAWFRNWQSKYGNRQIKTHWQNGDVKYVSGLIALEELKETDKTVA